MNIYRIYTERINVEWMRCIIFENFPNYTLYDTNGCYDGVGEKSIVFEIITDNPAAEHYLQLIALKIKGYNKQESVLMTKQKVEVL